MFHNILIVDDEAHVTEALQRSSRSRRILNVRYSSLQAQPKHWISPDGSASI